MAAGALSRTKYQQIYPHPFIVLHTACMTRQAFIPPPIPPSSRALVDTLKRRLTQAVDAGHPRDARIYLGIIERLARMHWLDDTLLVEAQEAERVRTTQAMADVKRRMARHLTEQNTDATQQQAQQPQKAPAQAQARMVALSESPFPWEPTGQALPTSIDIDIDAFMALETKRSDPKPAHHVAVSCPPVTIPRYDAKLARMTSRDNLTTSVRLPPQTR